LLGAFSFMSETDSIITIALDESMCPEDKKHRITLENKIEELNNVYELLGLELSNKRDVGGIVNQLHLQKYEVIKSIEDRINENKPDIILIPHPSYNQDHQTVHEACMVALRPHDKNHFVKKVLMYECPQSYIWGEPLTPNYFKEVDIKKKIKAYKLYKSQVRSYRSPELLKRMAEHRGKQANLKYAEGFKVVRWVNAKKRS